MRAERATVLLAAIFGSDHDDDQRALKLLSSEGLKARLLSGEEASRRGADPLGLRASLLPGEKLVVAETTATNLETPVRRLSGVGSPAVFLLPAQIPLGRDVPRHGGPPAMRPVREAIRELANTHGSPVPCSGCADVLKVLEDCERELETVRAEVGEAARLDHTLSPAAEWLVDNGYLFEVHIANVRKNFPRRYELVLPGAAADPRSPRIYRIAKELVEQTDSRLTAENVAECLEAYQSAQLLTMVELWVFPQVLRLAVIEEVARVAVHVRRSHQLRQFSQFWANRLSRAARAENSSRMLEDLERQPYALDPIFVTSLSEQMRDEPVALRAFRSYVEGDSALSFEDIVRGEHHEETANRASVANAVSTLRQLDRLDYQSIFEGAATVERILLTDPSGVHDQSDFSTRERCRHAVEQVSRTSPLDEFEVARRAIRMATEGSSPLERIAAYYLIGDGRERLEHECGSRPLPGTRFLRLFRRHATAFYLSGATLLSLSFVAVMMLSAWELAIRNPIVLAALTVLGAFPLSDLAIQIINALIFHFFPPDQLPRLSLRDGIPEGSATLVVVPTMFRDMDAIARDVAGLEVRYLGNRDPRLYFALYPDYPDAAGAEQPEDEALLNRAMDLISDLNLRRGPRRFFLFHRGRAWSQTQQVWMGKERKRGKIEDLNAFLLGEPSETRVSQPLAEPIRFVMTLDADTQLPPETAKWMIATLSYPLNRVELTPDGRNRARGYTIVQPRVSISLPSATATRFTRIYADASGTDPYCKAVSDVYQDLFREGIFHGKAIYDLQAFHAILHRRFPDEALLSHDLIEGSHVGVASASNIELFENMPVDYGSYTRRQHRWIRGDWQISAWIGKHVPNAEGGKDPNPLSIISRWRILDNLRRSLVAPATLALLLLGWFSSSSPGLWTVLIIVAGIMPGLAPLSEHLIRRLGGSAYGLRGAREELLRPFVALSLLPHQAWVSLDAVVRAVHRTLISGKRLLEWQTAEEADLAADGHQRRIIGECALISLGSLILCLLVNGNGFPWTAYFVLLLWMISPLTVIWLSRPTGTPRQTLETYERAFLSKMARLTWRYFDDLVGPEDHWLPPDNTQLRLHVEVAHRTSPTNIGLWLTSALSAHDFGFIATDRLLSSCTETVNTLLRLERYEGHWLNWYETRTLEPLLPRYISSVDSGNLLSSFWILEQGLNEIESRPVCTTACISGLEAIALLLTDLLGDEISARLPLNSITRLVARHSSSGLELVRQLTLLDAPVKQLAATRRWAPVEPSGERNYWIAKLEEQLSAWRGHVQNYLPWLETLAAAPDPFLEGIHPLLADARQQALSWMPSLADLAHGELPPLDKVFELAAGAKESQQRAWIEQLRAELEQSRKAARQACNLITQLKEDLRKMSETIRMGFLYDSKRRLFGIGYQVGGPVEFNAYYDLLASECRLASLVAIAKGDVPLSHWMSLGRPYVTTPEGQTLLSWNGTMFEFLMPLAYARAYENSFLATACVQAVRKQMDYGRQAGIPWGISEAAFSALDANQTYQYRAFGIPALGLKDGLEDDLVVSPYSSFLALHVLPREALVNLMALSADGMSGPMGLYESLDFTRESTRKGGRGVIVYAYMAHHQGMILMALDNVLNSAAMQRRFHANLAIQSVESLLYERVPSERSYLRRKISSRAAMQAGSEQETTPRPCQPNSPVPSVNLLGNGRYTLMVTAAGGGFSRWNDFDLTAWQADTTEDRAGSYFYIRDSRSGAVWSATHHPVAGEAGTLKCNFSADRAEFFRRVSDIETLTAICVSSEADVEVRRLTITNHGLRTRALEVTSYSELALAHHAAHSAHPVFSKLFVETEALPGGQTLIAHRRPRSPADAPIWVAHMLVSKSGVRAVQYETSRMAFLGRCRSATEAVGLGDDLTDSEGAVLDPVFSLRCRFTLEARGRIEISYLTMAASSREELLGLVARFREPGSVARAFETAWTQAQLEFRYLGLRSFAAHRFQELLCYLIYPHEALRPAGDRLAQNRTGQSGLWPFGISGDLPILLVTVADKRGVTLVRDLLVARQYWQMRGFSVDLVIIDQEPYSYDQPLREEINRMAHVDSSQRGGKVFILDWNGLNDEARALLPEAAHAVLAGGKGNLTQQLALPADTSPTTPLLVPRSSPEPEPSSELPFLELDYFNGIGGFSRDGREYAIYLKEGETTPLPWSNVIATPQFGTLVTESGLGFTWFGNSQSNRLTPWQNDPVRDPQSEIIYIRDQDSGEFWTPTALPIREESAYRARHGQGYTLYEHNSHAIRQELTVFVPLDEAGGDPVKVARLRLHNESSRRRTLSVTWFVEWVLGVTRETSQRHVQTSLDVDSTSLVARNAWQPSYGGRVAFLSMYPTPQSWTGDRTAFLGRNGRHESPEGMRRVRLDLRTGAGFDPAGAMRCNVTLEPGASVEVICMLGEGADISEVRSLVSRYRRPDEVEAALERTRQWWEQRLSTLQVRVPVLSVNLLLNRWLLYQTLSCRFWARSAFYQSSGAFGFRDQLQDSMALVYIAPEIARRHLLTAAARQFPQGDVQHWWHVETGAGPRTRCADDMLWLPYATAHYARITGDHGVLEELAPFPEGPELAPEEEEKFFVPAEDLSRGASLFEHCKRAIERGHNLGEHGLPLFGSGDWNDGMNRVGLDGKGESVWMGWFLAAVMREFAPLALEHGDNEFAAWLHDRAAELVQSVEQHCWDGAWYLRGFFDDGTPLGSSSSEEARIDSLPQTWAVLAGGGVPNRAHAAIRSAMELLVREDPGEVLLFTPPFDHSAPHPGYIMGYPPGIRENGGQYTHGSLWLPLAFAQLGFGNEAVRLLQLMNPIEGARDPETARRYGGEPYVSPADVSSNPQHLGLSGWTWYTGSSGWMYRVWIESVLGFCLRDESLFIRPALPADWSNFEITYRHGEALYHITVRREAGVRNTSTRIDGQVLEGDRIPLVRSAGLFEIEVLLPEEVNVAEAREESPVGSS